MKKCCLTLLFIVLINILFGCTIGKNNTESKIISSLSISSQNDKVVISGTAQKIKWYHEARDEWLNAYILKLDKPADFNLFSYDNSEPKKELIKDVTEIEIYSSEINLDDYLNKHITVNGSVFRAHTVYHQREVVLRVTEIK